MTRRQTWSQNKMMNWLSDWRNFWFAPRFMVFQRIRRITVKKARKFVLRKTNLRALRDFGIILYPDSGGINLVSTSDFRCFFQIVRAENPCNIKVFSTTGQPLWVTPTRQVEMQSKLFCIDRLIPFGLIWYQLSWSYGVSDFLLSKSYQGMLST